MGREVSATVRALLRCARQVSSVPPRLGQSAWPAAAGENLLCFTYRRGAQRGVRSASSGWTSSVVGPTTDRCRSVDPDPATPFALRGSAHVIFRRMSGRRGGGDDVVSRDAPSHRVNDQITARQIRLVSDRPGETSDETDETEKTLFGGDGVNGSLEGSKTRHYDPRMLVFEYARGVILRERQVALVRDFVSAASSARGAECAQMLMGEGKTTMICPLLGFMLANQETLVVQVVPQSLLEFSRGCLRRAFAGVVRRSVVTLKFDRFTPLTPAPLYALRKARRSQALVVTTPTALKSLVLKFLETAHLLDQSYVARVEGAAVRGGGSNTIFRFAW